jgi:hypothetical protein
VAGWFLAYAVAAAGGAGAAGGEICASAGARCEAEPASASDIGDVATPAEVDCRSVEGALTLAAVADALLEAGTCNDEEPALAGWYRASRAPDGGRSAGAVAPQRGRRAPARVLAACDRVPEAPPALTLWGALHPFALFAVPALVPPLEGSLPDAAERSTRSRMIEPLDRPPRA